MHRVFSLTALALLASLTLVACGDGDSGDGGESDGGTISKEEFIEQADAICSESADAQQRAQTALDTATSPEEAAAAYDELAEVSREVNDEINALGRPEGDEELIDDLGANQDELVGFVTDLADAIREQDQAAAEEIAAEFGALLDETGETLDSYGFEVC